MDQDYVAYQIMRAIQYNIQNLVLPPELGMYFNIIYNQSK